MEKTANLKVIFDTEHPDQLLNFLQNNQTPAIHTYADQVDRKAFVTATFYTTDIEKTMTELTDYSDAFIKRAFYNDDTQSQEENDQAKAWIATTIINQFDNRHDNISYYGRYQSQPVSSVSSYLESKDFKNGIFTTQYEDKLLCDLYGQTGEKTYLFEGNRKDWPMFQEIIQQLTDNHDHIITKFQEKIDSIESYYVLIAELINPTNIRLHIETEYDGGSIKGLCLKVMTLYVDNSKTHSKEDIKTLIETELEHAKERLKHFVPEFSDNTRVITHSQLEKIESTQPTELYDKALEQEPKITQDTKIFSPNRFNTYFEEN